MVCFTSCCLISTILTADECREACALRDTKVLSIENFFSLNKMMSPAALVNVKYDFGKSSWIDNESNKRVLSFAWQAGFPRYYDTLQTRSV